MERRKFLKSTSLLTAAGLLTAKFPLVAKYHTIIPADVKLNKARLKSLSERGTITAYAKTKK
jgi:hypothetical protein